MNAKSPVLCRIGHVDDIPREGARIVRLDTIDIAVFRTRDGGIFALENRCPHRGGPLSEGIVHGNAVTCPLHNWVIDLATGQATGADSGCVRTARVEVGPDGVLALDLASLPLSAAA
ncbi:MAG: nitrite reductase small subunit NirD [Bauldia sp.]|nr:nitrite reductase small subunit NirD [Bauldia sp.]MCW5718160.1 nitrite reductase small subunit NirD [Bauldia sp.]